MGTFHAKSIKVALQTKTSERKIKVSSYAGSSVSAMIKMKKHNIKMV